MTTARSTHAYVPMTQCAPPPLYARQEGQRPGFCQRGGDRTAVAGWFRINMWAELLSSWGTHQAWISQTWPRRARTDQARGHFLCFCGWCSFLVGCSSPLGVDAAAAHHGADPVPAMGYHIGPTSDPPRRPVTVCAIGLRGVVGVVRYAISRVASTQGLRCVCNRQNARFCTSPLYQTGKTKSMGFVLKNS